jgi:UDP-glucose 4-epimerase
MKYLVTGGAGFIGSHLAEYLLELDHEVEIYDNFSTGSMENVAHLQDSDGFRVTTGNVLDYHTLEGSVIRADRVVHLAAAVGVKLIMEEPVETLVTNVQGTENTLKLCNYHHKPLLVASTSEVYGKTMDCRDGNEPLSEGDDLTLGPTSRRRWAYACSKALDEFLALAYHEQKGLDVVVTRFFNTVGPRQTGRYGMVIPRFVERALANRQIEIHGDGDQTRCFTHVADAVEAVVLLMDADSASGRVVNIGNGEPISINDLAERIKLMTGSTSEVVHIPYEQVYGPGYEDMQSRTPDPSLLRELVDFVPSRGLEEILTDVIAERRVLEPSNKAG